jgi:signal transduction histidine kinase
MDDIIAINLYRIIKESLTNIAKYSYATNAQVQILFDSNITIIISDNGCGFGDEGKFKGHGINNMRDRTHALGGIFNITTSEQGVRIIAHVPYKISQIL